MKHEVQPASGGFPKRLPIADVSKMENEIGVQPRVLKVTEISVR
jgi:hypothetical protein